MARANIKDIERVWFTTRDLMCYLGVGMDFVKSLRENARIPFYKVGRTCFYSKNDIDRLIKGSRVI